MKAIDALDRNYDADREVDQFLKKYEARAGLSSRMVYQRRIPIRYADWLDDGAPIPFDQTVEREPMVEMNIPQHQFRRLVERESEFQDLIQGNERAHRVLHQHIQDEHVRDCNPAVQAAWMKYLTLLELARK